MRFPFCYCLLLAALLLSACSKAAPVSESKDAETIELPAGVTATDASGEVAPSEDISPSSDVTGV